MFQSIQGSATCIPSKHQDLDGFNKIYAQLPAGKDPTLINEVQEIHV